MHQAGTDTGADGRFAIAAQTFREQSCHFAISEWNVAETLRLYALLRALSQECDTISKGSDRLIDVFGFLESH